jgi:hypothetical protein
MDTGRDVAETELGKVATHDRNSFHQMNKDWGAGFEDDRAEFDDDPVLPGRKRQLTLASACILGECARPAPLLHSQHSRLNLCPALHTPRQRAVRAVRGSLCARLAWVREQQ